MIAYFLKYDNNLRNKIGTKIMSLTREKKIENPRISIFLDEFKSKNCRLAKPFMTLMLVGTVTVYENKNPK